MVFTLCNRQNSDLQAEMCTYIHIRGPNKCKKILRVGKNGPSRVQAPAQPCQHVPAQSTKDSENYKTPKIETSLPGYFEYL